MAGEALQPLEVLVPKPGMPDPRRFAGVCKEAYWLDDFEMSGVELVPFSWPLDDNLIYTIAHHHVPVLDVGWAPDFIELPNAHNVAADARNPIYIHEHAMLPTSRCEEHGAMALDVQEGAITKLDGPGHPVVHVRECHHVMMRTSLLNYYLPHCKMNKMLMRSSSPMKLGLDPLQRLVRSYLSNR
jgi:hypothetical protein